METTRLVETKIRGEIRKCDGPRTFRIIGTHRGKCLDICISLKTWVNHGAADEVCELIVRAVNAHDGLVELVQMSIRSVRFCENGGDCEDLALRLEKGLESALARVEGSNHSFPDSPL